MSPDTDKGMSPNIRDEDYLNEEDFKALLAGMEPDQNVSKTSGHSEEAVDGSGRNAIPNSSSSPLKEQLREGSRPYQDKDTQQFVKSESKENCKEEESAASGKEYGMQDIISPTGPINLKRSPVSTPVNLQARKASTVTKDHDQKRQRTDDALKDNSKKALDGDVKQKQSNLLGFFSKQ